MKKLMLILAVAIVAAPAMATITFVATDVGNGQLRIAYTTDDPDNDKPRGVALEVALDGEYDTVADNPAVSTDDAYNCFIDHAWDLEKEGGPGGYVLDTGEPLANPDTPGSLTAPADLFAISMGVLDETSNQLPGPTTSTDLITIQLTNDGGASTSNCTVTITGDTTRGPDSGVVGSTIPSNLSGGNSVTTIVFVPAAVPDECVKADAPFYDEWVGAGSNWEKPDCWCYVTQCRGNHDGIKDAYQVGSTDLLNFLDAFNKADFKLDNTKICADYDHKKAAYRCGSDDLVIFLTYFNKADFKVPACPLDWDGDLDDDYNFWIVP